VAGMTKYERALRARLREPERWPEFDAPDFLERLNAAAEKALSRRSVEGPLAAVLIYHQLVEEMLRLLVRDSHFVTQVALRPSRIEFASQPRQMFGQLQQEIREAVDFSQKAKLLKLADAINRIRVEVVHKLTRRGSLSGLTRDARRAKSTYDRIFAIFDDAHDDFRVVLSAYKRDLE